MKKIIRLSLIVMALLTLTGCGKKSIDVNKYITIISEGYDTVGRAYAEFDLTAFEKDYRDKLRFNDKYDKSLVNIDFGKIQYSSTGELIVKAGVNYELSQKDNLSNGDVITLHWDNDDVFLAECYNAEFVCSDIEYTVENLKPCEPFNPFDHINVSFSGMAPNGVINIEADSSIDELNYLIINVDKENNLRVGDEVTLSVIYKNGEIAFADRFGEIISESEKTYTVEKLAKYVTELDEIPQEINAKMDNQLVDYFVSYTANNWENPSRREDMEFVGNYLLTAKDGMNPKNKNLLYYIYKVNILDEEKEPFSYYWYGCFNDIILLEDGTCSVDISNYTVCKAEASFLGHYGDYLPVGKKHYVAGFADVESIFNQHVVGRMENYNYVSTVHE